MAKLTKRMLLDTVTAQKDDPAFISRVIRECYDVLPKNLGAYLSKQMYAYHGCERVYYEVFDRLHGTYEYFFTVNEIYESLLERFPSLSKSSVYTAIERGHALHDQIIKKKDPTT